ncbi:hypothetical protein ACWEJS_26800 [Rhodococcus triatomae]
MGTPTRASVRSRILLAGLGAALAGSALTTPAAAAAPADTARIEVLAADGVTPLGESAVHEGDRIVVRGTGFDPPPAPPPSCCAPRRPPPRPSCPRSSTPRWP